MKKQLIIFLAALLVIAFACQKELSFESPNTPAKGSLKDNTLGDCLPQTVNGIYLATTPLVPATNTITVQVDVARAGSYTIYTDTVNGYFFRTTGVFTTTGLNNVTLRSSGTPFAAGVDNFVVTFDTTVCDIAVTVLPAGTGAAVFTLAGSPGSCSTPTINGPYTVGTALGASNRVVLNVNVTTAGSYNVTTTAVNGMTFSGTGTLAVGPQTITLTGSGTPTTSGANVIPVTAGSSNCSFTINVTGGGGPAVFTLVGSPGSCTTPTINGTYTVGTALGASNTVVLNVNVTTAGSYNITTTAVNGMTFTGSGTLALGNQTITLTGSGTPTTAGANVIAVTAGSSNCSFTITVGGPAVCTLNGSPGNCTSPVVSGVYIVGTALGASNTVTLNVTVTTAGSYNVTTTAVNGMTFSGSGTLALGPQTITLTGSGSPTTSGNNAISVSVNGSPSCTFTIYVLPNDYYPRTANSNWSYEWDDAPTDSLYRTATSNTLTAAGNTFTIFMSNDGTGLDSGGYFRRSGTDYFEWFDFGSWIGYDNPLWVEYSMLQSAAAVNTPWKSPPTGGWSGTANGNPFTLRFSYKIPTGQKDVPITITTSGTPATVTYQNVIVVEERIEMEVSPGNWQDITNSIDYYGKSYYARGIGLIKFEALNAASVVQAKMELRRWQVF
jgi:hypothetical protein